MITPVSVTTLTNMLAPHMDKPAWPGLDCPATRQAAAGYAKACGIWDNLTGAVEPDAPLAPIRRSLFRQYARTGERAAADAAYRQIIQKLEHAALALWLDHPAASLDELQDRMWAMCDAHTWVMTAHEYVCVDLGSSRIANLLSELVWLFRDRIEDEVRDRVRAAVEERVLAPAYDYRTGLGWRTNDMNWNAVCNGNVISAALYHFSGDVHRLATYLQPVVPRLQFAIDGFCDDGSCREGAGYWDYGFGHLVDTAIVLHHRTGGQLNLMASDKMRRISEFPLAVQIDGPHRACFGDCRDGTISAGTALRINRFFELPELYHAARHREDGTLAVETMRDLAIYEGQRAGTPPRPRDAYLPEFGFAKLRAGTGSSQPATVCALAGRNDLPHNHNDVGSFTYTRGGICYLTDPGSPRYTAKTFGPRRYEIIQCRSLGHSVPFINGGEQLPGGAYYGVMTVGNLDGEGDKTAAIDMTHAYEDPGLKSLVRTLHLHTDGSLDIVDAYSFHPQPSALAEHFMTFEAVAVSPDGQTVTIGPDGRTVQLTAPDCAGNFSVESLDMEDARENGVTLSRIAFIPLRLAPEMTLRLHLS